MPVTWISQLLLHHTQYIGVVALFPASHATVHDSANNKHESFSGGRFVSTPRPCISKVCNIIQSGCKTADELFNVSALGQIVQAADMQWVWELTAYAFLGYSSLA
jgi:hypothetical protein